MSSGCRTSQCAEGKVVEGHRHRHRKRRRNCRRWSETRTSCRAPQFYDPDLIISMKSANTVEVFSRAHRKRTRSKRPVPRQGRRSRAGSRWPSSTEGEEQVKAIIVGRVKGGFTGRPWRHQRLPTLVPKWIFPVRFRDIGPLMN